jgi:hypothetical protein
MEQSGVLRAARECNRPRGHEQQQDSHGGCKGQRIGRADAERSAGPGTREQQLKTSSTAGAVHGYLLICVDPDHLPTRCHTDRVRSHGDNETSRCEVILATR